MYQQKDSCYIAKRFSKLSQRQQQVAALASDGLSNKTIAVRLGISEGTVKAHLHAIYGQLGIRSRIKLMMVLAHQERSKSN